MAHYPADIHKPQKNSSIIHVEYIHVSVMLGDSGGGQQVIATFPEFSDVTSELQPEIQAFTHQFPDYSDFNFVSLQSWNIDNGVQLAWLNQNLVCQFRDYQTGKSALSFLGNHQATQTAHTLLDQVQQANPTQPAQLELVPESSLGDIPSDGTLQVVEDPDNFDYVISMPLLAKLEGSAFTNVRKAANTLQKHNPDARLHTVDLHDNQNHQAMRDIFIQREETKAADYANEYLAFDRLLSLSLELGVTATGVMVENTLRAFIVYELSTDHQAAGHFWKADTSYRGVYQFLMHSVAKELHSQGVETMNIQQDLGLSGLRRAKQFLRPIQLLKKFTIRRA